MKHLTHIALAVTVLTCGFAQAQMTDFNPSWYISPSVNVSQPDNQMGADRNTNGIGLRMGKPISPAWDIQFGLTGTRTSDTIPRYRQTTFGIDGLYMLSRGNVRPFLLLGTGVQYDEIDWQGASTNQTSPFLGAGVGVQVGLSDQWALQADLRRNHGFREGNNLGVDSSNSNYFTVSLNYTFDKPAAPRYVAPPVTMPVVTAPAPAPYVAPPPPAAPPPPRFERYTLSATELFAFDSFVLRMPQPKLDEMASALAANRDVSNVTITGYTDRLGSNKYNQSLSERRAMSVKSYLVSKGLDSSRLNAVGKGEADPVVVCKETKRAALIECLEPNRRVVIDQVTVQRRVP